LWTLNLIAEEMEQPFGNDSNDLNLEAMQEEMNHHLATLTGNWQATAHFFGNHYAQKLIVANICSVLCKNGGFEHSGLTIELRLLVGIGRSGMLRGIIAS